MPNVLVIIYCRVLSYFACSLQGSLFYLFCTCSFSCVLALTIDRYEALRRLAYPNVAKQQASHWWFLELVGFPLLAVYAEKTHPSHPASIETE